MLKPNVRESQIESQLKELAQERETVNAHFSMRETELREQLESLTANDAPMFNTVGQNAKETLFALLNLLTTSDEYKRFFYVEVRSTPIHQRDLANIAPSKVEVLTLYTSESETAESILNRTLQIKERLDKRLEVRRHELESPDLLIAITAFLGID